MKKQLTKLLAVTLVLSSTVAVLAACNKTKQEEQTTTKKPVETIEKTPDVYNLSINGSISDLDDSYDISEILYGLFLEDINHAVDGGLYAEMIKNRSFEYGSLATNGAKHGYTVTDKSKLSFDIADGAEDGTALNENNTHYAILTNTSDNYEGIYNTGYLDGMAVEEGKDYLLSVYLKSLDGYNGSVKVVIKDKSGAEIASATIDSIKNSWWKYEATLSSTATSNSGVSCYVMIENGSVAVDMISLFPKDTYNGRENGLRADLVEYLEALNPSFLRFPGGCVIEGKSLETAYSWKDSIGNGLEFVVNGNSTIGDVAARKQGIDIWADLNKASSNPYYVTYGVGFYEYFLLCEDLNCLGVPIVNAGMSCPIQSPNYTVVDVNSDEFKQYVQDALDLVEFCRGDKNTTWGAVRIAMGHEEPFDLKYVGIGNEQWQEEYFEHYELFKKAFEDAAKNNPEMYGDIELILANGPASGDRFGWDKVNKNGADYAGLVDEHYYQTPSWFLENVHRYDKYKRDSVPVFLGEYAAKSNNWEAALAEAAYMTGIEANADIVKMACYAPLFGNSTSVQWTPDLIWFKNNQVWGSTNYYVQKIFATNVGTTMLDADLELTSKGNIGLSGKVGIGTWSTSATFDNLKVVSNETDEVLYEETFDEASSKSKFSINAGKFQIKNGVMKQTNTAATVNETTGDTAFVGDSSWSNYTYTLEATKVSGDEGFLIPIAVTDENNFIFWNLGGWGNTVSCLQIVTDGAKSDQVSDTVLETNIKTGETYKLKIIVEGNNIKCYMNKFKMIDYTYEPSTTLFQSSSFDEETGDIIIKLVNVSNVEKILNLNISNFDNMNPIADVTQLSAKNKVISNTGANPKNIYPKDFTMDVREEFTYTVPKYSVTVIRIHPQD
ncbi:MAG: hypothetical protein E7266_04970 [Lachnospiraceae bacterium]|nr:hypothetical protein [Lachnospiraceae bacterium]